MNHGIKCINAVLLIGLCLLGCSALHTARDLKNNDLRVEELIKTSNSWDGSLLPEYPSGRPEITILRIVVPPGFRLKTHFHPVINAGVLIKGRLTVIREDGKKLHLKEGDALVEVVDTLHYGINEGSEPAEIIVFYAGIRDKPITVIKP